MNCSTSSGRCPRGPTSSLHINCASSDYSPVGHGLFGGLACFRDNKEGYRKVKSKHDLFRVWGTMTGFVQETFLVVNSRGDSQTPAIGDDKAGVGLRDRYSATVRVALRTENESPR